MGRLSRPFTVGGEKAFSFANTGVFTEEVVVTETQAVVIDPDVPLSAACLIGCAIVTGAGAVLNRARFQPGQSVVVIGAGGIGQAAIQAARIAAAGRIVVANAAFMRMFAVEGRGVPATVAALVSDGEEEAGRELAVGIPGSQFVALQGQNHFPLEQDPATERMLEEIKLFLKK